jgi:hypothetical protein
MRSSSPRRSSPPTASRSKAEKDAVATVAGGRLLPDCQVRERPRRSRCGRPATRRALRRRRSREPAGTGGIDDVREATCHFGATSRPAPAPVRLADQDPANSAPLQLVARAAGQGRGRRQRRCRLGQHRIPGARRPSSARKPALPPASNVVQFLDVRLRRLRARGGHPVEGPRAVRRSPGRKRKGVPSGGIPR